MADPAEHPESWSPEDEPASREEALAYERFVRVMLKEEGGRIPEALARKYLNVLLDSAFAKAQPRTHARMLENFHRMTQADAHLHLRLELARAQLLGRLGYDLPGELQPPEAQPTDYHIHVHPPKGVEEGPCSCGDPSCTSEDGEHRIESEDPERTQIVTTEEAVVVLPDWAVPGGMPRDEDEELGEATEGPTPTESNDEH
jgi:hypothetical protein